MKHRISAELLKKYLQGKTTPQESALVDEWYASIGGAQDDLMMGAEEWEKIEKGILNKVKNIGETPAEKSSANPWLKKSLRMAASIAAITAVGISVLYFSVNPAPGSRLPDKFVSNEVVQKITNDSPVTTIQVLSDGTVIKLAPHSSLEFPHVFAASKREVLLRGEAFFDVAKDKKRPFIITTSDVTIRVLGTSFNVKAYEGAKETNVAVRTGIVSVSAKTRVPGVENEEKTHEVILTPNQEFTYNALHENFSRKLVDAPQIILKKPTLFKMQYDGMSVGKIFDVLEENYGIDIFYDEQDLSNCVLTTSMEEEGLYERIEIITKAIGAQYEITDSRIIIKSNGCP
jgi:transmembrane sensor